MANTSEEIEKAVKDGLLLDLIHNASVEREDIELVNTLVRLNNEGKLNLLEEFLGLKNDGRRDFFLTREVLGSALPQLTSPVEEVMECVKHLIKEAGNDLASDWLLTPFGEYCKSNHEKIGRIIEIAIDESNEDFDFLTSAILSGASVNIEKYVDIAISLISPEKPVVTKRAIFSLGRIRYDDNLKLIEKAVNAIENILCKVKSDLISSSTLNALVSILTVRHEEEERVLQILTQSDLEVGEHFIHTAASMLAFNGKKVSISVVKYLFSVAVNVSPQNTGTIQRLDMGLYHLVDNSREEVFGFLEELIAKSDNKIGVSSFNSLKSHLFQRNKNALFNLISRWFGSKDIRLCRNCRDLFDKATDDVEISVDYDAIEGFPDGILLFLARKACGWFFHIPTTAISFIFSLIKDGIEEEEFSNILEVAFFPLLVSYSGGVKEYIENVESEVIKKNELKEKLLKRLEEFQSESRSAGDIKELQVSEYNKEIYLRYHSALMKEAYDKAQEGSLFMSGMFSKSIILYGRSSIHYTHHAKGKERQQMQMHEISHSVEFPSLSVISPSELDNILRVFRTEGCSR